MSTPLLRVEGLSKRFPGVVALDDVSLEVRPREVVGLVGENGAGKSTLLRMLAGVERPDSGRILVRGKPVRFNSTIDANRVGLTMVFQEQSLIPNVTVAENIMLGHEGAAARFGVYRWSALYERSAVQLAKLGLDLKPSTLTEQLTFGQRQMIELARALAIEERVHVEPVVLLDEPTSVLDEEEIEVLFAQLARIRTRASVIFVSHRLDEVLRVSDRVYVMRDGSCTAERDAKTCKPAELHELMVGRSGGDLLAEEPMPCDRERIVLSARGLSRNRAFEDVSFDLHAGEVLGIAGVIGSGREELSRALFGALPLRGGEIRVDDRRVRLRTPADAVKAGIGFIPAERRHEGLAMGMTIADNMVLAFPRAVSRGPLLHRGRWRKVVADWMARMQVRAPGPHARVEHLSGGNQQKVVLAKWLLSERLRVLLLDHPTRGLDIGAKQDVYALIRELSKQGIGCVLLADTLEEVIGLSHTIMVMRDGEISKRLVVSADSRPTPVDIVRAMV